VVVADFVNLDPSGGILVKAKEEGNTNQGEQNKRAKGKTKTSFHVEISLSSEVKPGQKIRVFIGTV
jgi:hypothetical protein